MNFVCVFLSNLCFEKLCNGIELSHNIVRIIKKKKTEPNSTYYNLNGLNNKLGQTRINPPIYAHRHKVTSHIGTINYNTHSYHISILRILYL